MRHVIAGVFISGLAILTLGACGKHVAEPPAAARCVDEVLLAEWIQSYMMRWDEDGDGLLSKPEFHGRPVAFVQADADEDNILHYGELMALLGGGEPIQYSPKRFAAARDFDGDGAVSKSEWMQVEPGDSLFKTIDADANDTLSLAEIETFLYRYERRLEPVAEVEEADQSPDAPADTQPSAGVPLEQLVEPPVEPEPENLVANPSFEENDSGWMAHNSTTERVGGEGLAAEGLYALKCATEGQLYDGVLYGCAKANVCDVKTLPCEPGAAYAVSVMVKGVSNFEGVRLQLQVIGGAGESFGTAKTQLDGSWQKLSLTVTTKADTTFLGAQIVKDKNDAPATFLIDDLRVVAAP
jgi:hypothetical protein